MREAAVATLSCLPKNELAAHAAAMAAILNHERPHPRDDDVERRKKLGGPPQKAEKHGPRESAALALALLEPDALQAQIPCTPIWGSNPTLADQRSNCNSRGRAFTGTVLIERLGDPVKSVRDAVVAALGRLPPGTPNAAARTPNRSRPADRLCYPRLLAARGGRRAARRGR